MRSVNDVSDLPKVLQPVAGRNTFGRSDFIRFPWPAARITMESGTARVGSFLAM